ncbi:MAG: RNA-directed DNA polymerase [Planctomycetes bacterium]|nr:RNA-directed DNA polymerase [Planctomycetota bacterium]
MLALAPTTWACYGIPLGVFLSVAIFLRYAYRRAGSESEKWDSLGGRRWRCERKGDGVGELRERVTRERVWLPGSKRLPQKPSNAQKLGDLGIPVLKDTADILRWLGVDLKSLLPLANPERRVRPGKSNYVEWTVKKRRAGLRVICSPKPRLKAIQRKIKAEILDRAPVHMAAHGFVRTRSIATNAAGHVGRKLVVNLDLRNFFEHIRIQQVYGVFRHLGYGSEVSRWLARLCTHAPQLGEASRGLDGQWEMQRIRRHAVQGAPTSPALANLACLRLDRRLTGLAKKFDAEYTRYADDLTFSGDERFKRGMKRFLDHLHMIIRLEGFSENYVKRRFMRSGQRQQVTGVVVNQRVNVARDEYDRLKAIIHNARKTGLDAQNRDHRPDFRAYLLGRAAHVAQLNPERGRKLVEAIRAVS